MNVVVCMKVLEVGRGGARGERGVASLGVKVIMR